jgi:hypothetical protein
LKQVQGQTHRLLPETQFSNRVFGRIYAISLKPGILPGVTGAFTPCRTQHQRNPPVETVSHPLRDQYPAREVYWVSAESLDEALRYLRQRYDDLLITEARCAGMVALLAGSPPD